MQLFSDSAIVTPPRAGEYRTILADPPWLERGGGQIKRGADRHYPLMSTDAICTLPVREWTAPDAHLYLWVTNNFLPDGLRVMQAWGFRYVTKIDWYKGYFDPEAFVIFREALRDVANKAVTVPLDDFADRAFAEMCEATCESDLDEDFEIGLGQYFRGCTESCLFGVRGRLPYRTRPNGKRAQGRTGFHAPRGLHSAKPEKLREMVELVSHGPYLEMFARSPAEGWDLWGNQAPVHAGESA